MARTPHSARGFTLIELMVVLAIVAFVAVAAAPALGSVTGATARGAAGQVAGAMRWMFDTAALRHQTCRLAFDLDHRSWWAECTVEAKPGAPPEDEDALKERFPEERTAEGRQILANGRFGEFKSREVRRRSLPGSAAFAEVWAQHQVEPASRGTAYVYFFPQGMAEAARVTVADGDNVYTVVLHPLTGHARVVPGKPEVRR